MSYDSKGFNFRADECVRLANLAQDDMIQRELLTLRQTYLKAAERLRDMTIAAAPRGQESRAV